MAAAVCGLSLVCVLACGSASHGEDARAHAAGPCAVTISPDASPGASASANRHHRARAGAVQRLVWSLQPGQTGCLRGGSYSEDVTVARSQIELRSAPGETARLVGRLWFTRNAHDDTVRALVLDGRNASELPSPTVNGSAISFLADEVTNENTNICFLLGSSTYGRARETLIGQSRIHNCGRPARNTEHGIYVAFADGTQIVGNAIYDNANRGIQLYPDAQHTLIEGNVIDGNGEGIIFSGALGLASSNNLVQHNVISNPQIRADIESWYPSGNPVGVANVVRQNCLYGPPRRTVAKLAGGFVASGNVIADPMFADAQSGDFRVDPSSPCAQVLAGAAAASRSNVAWRR